MSIWRHLREEAAGAIRSVRYDIGARRGDSGPAPDEIRPRHRLAALGLGLLVLGGAVGTYFAVVGGLNALLADGSDGSSPPGTTPSVVTVPNGPATGSWAPPLEPIGGAPPPIGPGVTANPVATKPAPPVPTPRPSCRCTTPPAPSVTTQQPTTPPPTTPPPTTPPPTETPTPTPSPEAQ